jgi:23S rRNA (cytosine1962-C5)-methyltransferase
MPPGVRLPAGTWVRARCGNWSGYAIWDAEGPIALRVFSNRQVPDNAWLRARVAAAWQLREPLRIAGCTAYRWLFGEGDGLPGLTVDRYGDYATLQCYSDGVATLSSWLAQVLRAHDLGLRGVIARHRRPGPEEDREPGEGGAREGGRDRPSSPAGLVALSGEAPTGDLVVTEHGLRFYADLHSGQKTGLFLDQRENRRFVEGLSAGRRVLNCFAYTGAFGLYALRGGARSVISADIGKGLAEVAAANIALNRVLDGARHRFVTADCFELLAAYRDEERRFDMVILDPPSFAKSKANRYAAIRAYTKLNALALHCVAEGGLLASASCTSQVGPEAFKEMLASAAAQTGRRLQIVHEAGQPLDHPVPAQFPEGRYLKFVVARVMNLV